ncbi:hypothetical protein HMPREF0083_05544 [Aneurinibacillus aneurinilyticus ATCC 12856]|uniref:Uncharacterized protein n=1 Tax=Aneurinibacillus aneurinilyticus ATCC 12856 TaxID=649747 RepID=U1Y0D8_ANEAE|nr:hypothetical protein HMPREF0083_05544 [Aneurinibacillus aneurinilyticus ATCC 12856]
MIILGGWLLLNLENESNDTDEACGNAVVPSYEIDSWKPLNPYTIRSGFIFSFER